MITAEVDFTRLPQPILADNPGWIELYHKAWRIASRNIRVHNSGRAFMDNAWDASRNYQWVWDSCFVSLFCRYASDQFPGIQSLDNFYELQRDDGYMAMTYDMDSGEEAWPNRINPPLFAWAEWEYYEATGDDSRLSRVVCNIEKLMAWIDLNRRTAPHRRSTLNAEEVRGFSNEKTYQLYYFEDGGSSGLDDSPRTPRVAEAGQFFEWIDLSSQMALSFRCVAAIHRVLKQKDHAEYWRQRFETLGELINAELWCHRTRFYHDRALPLHFVAHKTVAGFWPMLAGFCTDERVEYLVEHLLDSNEFNRPTPIPSLSFDDPNYEGSTYWVGGVWAPTNYMVLRGLAHCGRSDVAHEIALRYLGALARVYQTVEPHTLWECYSAEDDSPGLAPYTLERVKPDFVGWSGLGPIAILIENVIGLRYSAPRETVDWDIRLTQEHGLKQLALANGGRADFFCHARADANAPAHISVRSDLPIKLHVRRGEHSKTLHLLEGKAETSWV